MVLQQILTTVMIRIWIRVVILVHASNILYSNGRYRWMINNNIYLYQKNNNNNNNNNIYLFLGFTHVTNSLATVTIRHVGVPQA